MNAAVQTYFDRALRALDRPPSEPPWNLSELADLIGLEALRPAAVLVALVERAAGWQVLLTRRQDDLPQHGGQVSLPGGGSSAGDASPLATALRETYEEVGIAVDRLVPLGYLPPYATISSFRVVPVVARLDADYQVRIDPREVSAVFEVPLALFADRARRRWTERPYRGRVRGSWVFDYGGHRIWGATAAILVDFTERLREAGWRADS